MSLPSLDSLLSKRHLMLLLIGHLEEFAEQEDGEESEIVMHGKEDLGDGDMLMAEEEFMFGMDITDMVMGMVTTIPITLADGAIREDIELVTKLVMLKEKELDIKLVIRKDIKLEEEVFTGTDIMQYIMQFIMLLFINQFF